MQNGRTSNMIFSVPDVVSRMQDTLTLFAGDVIFTGPPAGIGWVRTPRVLLTAGDELVTTGEQIGSMRHRFTTA